MSRTTRAKQINVYNLKFTSFSFSRKKKLQFVIVGITTLNIITKLVCYELLLYP